MIRPFPEVRYEESTYSIFSRLQFMLQPLCLGFMGITLFNSNTEVGRLNFQGSFDYLCNNLPTKFTSENFLYNNTIYPLFVPFISTEKQEKALEYFKGNYPDKMNRWLTLSNVNKNRRYIRVCKKCVKEDFRAYGEPYYRRQHEIELNRMCFKHKTPLYEYIISSNSIPRKYYDYYTVLGNSKEIIIPKEFRKKFLNISDDINTIFTSNLNNWNIKITKEKIHNKLAEKGYITINGASLQLKFCEDFKKYYTEEFLNCIGYNFDISNLGNWLRLITRKNPGADPIKFILFIRFLFGSFKEFYGYNKEFAIFKKGPYPCLNKICPNYNKLVIKNTMQVKISNGLPVASFICEHCGYTYCRRGPDMNDSDIYKKTYVKDYGHLCHDKLKECIAKGFNINKTTKILGSNSPSTVAIWVNKYKNSNLVNSPKIEVTNNHNNLLLEQYKHEILNFIKESPTATKLNIYRSNKKAYIYLSKNDKEWLLNNIKFVKKAKTISREETLKRFWINKDELLSNDLLKAIHKIKSETNPHKRITVYILQNYIKYYNLNINIRNLPKCSQILHEVCETLLDYQKRRVTYVMKEMADNSIKITIVQVLRNANLGTRANVGKEILNYIEEKVNEYNGGNVIVIKNKR